MNKKNKFRDFVYRAVEDILRVSNLPTQKINILFKEAECVHDDSPDNNVPASIVVLSNYQEFQLFVYKALLDIWNMGDMDKVVGILCHEIGHVHSNELVELAESPYKTFKEVEKADEQLATKIGLYLEDRLGGICNCQKNLNKKNKKH